MKKMLMGQETEYAMVAVSRSGEAIPMAMAVEALLNQAKKSLVHLRAHQTGGVFISNASQLYRDTGDHLEYASPEVTNPWDVVRYQLAMDRILVQLTADLPTVDPRIHRMNLYRSNVDYATGSDATWGCHESYLHQRKLEEFSSPLMAFLVSRIIISGSGGWDSLSNGLEFLLSPRVAHLTCEQNSDSTRNRPIFHKKNESHAGEGYHRLHLICGESVCSETSAILKTGTTALVVAMIDAGINLAKLPRLVQPLAAMKRFAGDPTLHAVAQTTGGHRMSAIQLQRCYLEAVESMVGLPIAPTWAGRICRLWRGTLDRLDRGGADELSGTLDWAIKRAVFKAHTDRSCVRWDQLPVWNWIAGELGRALQRKDVKPENVVVERILGSKSPVRKVVKRLTPYLKRQKLDWDGLRPFVDLRQALFELDTRYSQLGREGLFAVLEQDGALDHHVEGVKNIEQAEQFPPASGRAAVRGRVIRRLAGTKGVFCDWSVIVTDQGARMLDLTDPFCAEELWEDYSDEKTRELGTHPSPMLRLIFGDRWLRDRPEFLRERRREAR